MKHKYFDIAKRLSYKSLYCHQLAAVVVKKNIIVGRGYNKPNKTHPRATNAYHTIHAELDAILGVDAAELIGADIYVFRQFKNGEPAMAKPCKHCETLLRQVGIKNVYYTANHSYEVLKFDNRNIKKD